MPNLARAFLHILIVVVIGAIVAIGALVMVADKLYEAIKSILSVMLLQ